MLFQVIQLNLVNNTGQAVKKWLQPTLHSQMAVTYHKPMYINKIVFSDGSEKEFSDAGTRAMKETTAYMMTEMMKTVLAYGTGRGAYLHGFHKQVKLVHQTTLMKRLKTTLKQVNFVAPDEMFVGYTRKYSMAVWTGYSNRLTPIIGDGFTVATSIYVYDAISSRGRSSW